MGLSIFEPVGLALLVLLFGIAFMTWRLAVAARRERFIRHYTFPPGLFKRLQTKRPELTLKDCNLVAQALRQFFLVYLMSRKRFVSMPSQAADDLWHEFILYTRNYQGFCRQAFGGFLHHTPATVLGRLRLSNEGLRRSWWYACKDENLDPKRPSRLPLLFAIDAKLNLTDGFQYAPNCEALRRQQQSGIDGSRSAVHCGGDFSSQSYDGTTDGFGESHGSAEGGIFDGHADSDGHGCGGGGCGGGGGD